MSLFFKSKKNQPVKDEIITDSAAAAVKIVEPVLAKGSCGDIKLYNVPEHTAAMLMAVVADKLKTPLNQLRFKSIKEIKE